MEIDELAVKITGDSTSLQTAMKDATDSMEKLGINTSALTGLLGAAGLSAAFKMAYDAADKMVQAFRDDETAQLKYNAALAASAVITAQGKKALDDYVPVFASLAGIAEADTQSMIAMLAATGRSNTEIKMMMETALGMSNSLGGDVNTALTQLTQTFTGLMPRTGAVKLALADLSVEQLKNGEGVRVLNEKYGKFADTLKDSTDVSIKNYKNAWSDLMSTMGASIAETIMPLRDAMTGLFRGIIKDANDSNSTLTAIANGFNNFVNIFKQGFLSLFGQGDIIKALDQAFVHSGEKAVASAAAWAEANKGQSEDLEALRLKAVAAATERGNAEKAAAKTASDAWEAANKKIIEGRKDAAQKYAESLAKIDTRVNLGIITEQDAADAKYAANKKLIDDLITLGYTGDAASKSIGDQTLAAAIARNANLYANTKDVVEAILTEEARILAQQKEVADWEKAYLEKRAAESKAVTASLVQDVVDYAAYVLVAEKANQAVEAGIVADMISGNQKIVADAAALEAQTKKFYAAKQALIEKSEKAVEAAADKQEKYANQEYYDALELADTRLHTANAHYANEEALDKHDAAIAAKRKKEIDDATAQVEKYYATKFRLEEKATASADADAIKQQKYADDAYYDELELADTRAHTVAAHQKNEEKLDAQIAAIAAKRQKELDDAAAQVVKFYATKQSLEDKAEQAADANAEKQQKYADEAYYDELELAETRTHTAEAHYKAEEKSDALAAANAEQQVLYADKAAGRIAGINDTALAAHLKNEELFDGAVKANTDKQIKYQAAYDAAVEASESEKVSWLDSYDAYLEAMRVKEAKDEKAQADLLLSINGSTLDKKILAIQQQLAKDLELVKGNVDAEAALRAKADKDIAAAKANVYVDLFNTLTSSFGSLMDSQTKAVLQSVSSVGAGIAGVIATGGTDLGSWVKLIGSGISLVVSLFSDSEEKAKKAAEAAKVAAEAAKIAQSALDKAIASEYSTYSLQYAQKSAAQARAAYLDYYSAVAAKQAELASYPAKMAYEISQVDAEAQGAAAAIRRIQARYAELTAETTASIAETQKLGDKYKAVYDTVYSGDITAAASSVRKEWYDALKAAVDTYGATSNEVAAINEYYSALVDKTVNPFKYALQDANDALAENKALFSGAGKAAEAYKSVLAKVVSSAANFYASLQNVGSDIASKLVDNFKSGLTKANFLDTMKEYLTDLVLQTAIYTDALKTKMAEIGTRIAAGIASGMGAAEITSIRDELAALYESASASAATAKELVSSAFAAPVRALGGVARGSTWVGERGAELVDLPAGSYVHDAQESKRIAADRGSQSQTFNFYSPTALTPAEMKRQFKIAQRQAAFLGAAG